MGSNGNDSVKFSELMRTAHGNRKAAVDQINTGTINAMASSRAPPNVDLSSRILKYKEKNKKQEERDRVRRHAEKERLLKLRLEKTNGRITKRIADAFDIPYSDRGKTGDFTADQAALNRDQKEKIKAQFEQRNKELDEKKALKMAGVPVKGDDMFRKAAQRAGIKPNSSGAIGSDTTAPGLSKRMKDKLSKLPPSAREAKISQMSAVKKDTSVQRMAPPVRQYRPPPPPEADLATLLKIGNKMQAARESGRIRVEVANAEDELYSVKKVVKKIKNHREEERDEPTTRYLQYDTIPKRSKRPEAPPPPPREPKPSYRIPQKTASSPAPQKGKQKRILPGDARYNPETDRPGPSRIAHSNKQNGHVKARMEVARRLPEPDTDSDEEEEAPSTSRSVVRKPPPAPAQIHTKTSRPSIDERRQLIKQKHANLLSSNRSGLLDERAKAPRRQPSPEEYTPPPPRIKVSAPKPQVEEYVPSRRKVDTAFLKSPSGVKAAVRKSAPVEEYVPTQIGRGPARHLTDEPPYTPTKIKGSRPIPAESYMPMKVGKSRPTTEEPRYTPSNLRGSRSLLPSDSRYVPTKPAGSRLPVDEPRYTPSKVSGSRPMAADNRYTPVKPSGARPTVSEPRYNPTNSSGKRRRSPEPYVPQAVPQGLPRRKNPTTTSNNPVSRYYAEQERLMEQYYGEGHESDYEDEDYDSDMDGFIVSDNEVDDESEDNGSSPSKQSKVDYSKYIREITGYDKRRYRNEQSYISARDMESSYSNMIREENFSTKLAVKEDAEELRKELGGKSKR